MVTNKKTNVANISKAMSEKLSWILGGEDRRFFFISLSLLLAETLYKDF